MALISATQRGHSHRRANKPFARVADTGQRYGVFGDLIPFPLLRRQHHPAARFQFQRFHDDQTSMDFCFPQWIFALMFSTKHFGQKIPDRRQTGS